MSRGKLCSGFLAKGYEQRLLQSSKNVLSSWERSICVRQCQTKATTIYKLAKELLFWLLSGVHQLLYCLPEWPAKALSGRIQNPAAANLSLVILTLIKLLQPIKSYPNISKCWLLALRTKKTNQPTNNKEATTQHTHKDERETQATREYPSQGGQEHKRYFGFLKHYRGKSAQ